MATGERKDPLLAYRFSLGIDGITRAGFRECSGLDSTQAPIEYREGNDKPNNVRKLPGLVQHSNITLKWGVVADETDIWEWRTAAVVGGKALDLHKNISISLLDEAGEAVLTWNLLGAWPTKWTGASMNATGNEVAVQTLEIAYEGMEKA